MAKNILVTGGAGFIGSHLTDRLIEQGYNVVIIDNLSTGRKENINPKADFYKLDICNFEKIRPLFKDIDYVFHLAAQIDVRKSVEDVFKDAEINILGGLNVLESCRYYKVKKIIFTSTGGAIYGDAKIIPTPEDYPEFPLSPYGVAKLTIEKYLNYYKEAFGLKSVSLRLANVYGPRQNSKGEAGVVAIFCDKILSGRQPVINGDGRQTRDFVYVEDVAKAGILAMEKNKSGIFNIGTAKETDINTTFRKIKKLISSDVKEIHVPVKPGEQRKSCISYSKAERELEWQPKVSLDEGIKKTVEYFGHKLKNSNNF